MSAENDNDEASIDLMLETVSDEGGIVNINGVLYEVDGWFGNEEGDSETDENSSMETEDVTATDQLLMNLCQETEIEDVCKSIVSYLIDSAVMVSYIKTVCLKSK